MTNDIKIDSLKISISFNKEKGNSKIISDRIKYIEHNKKTKSKRKYKKSIKKLNIIEQKLLELSIEYNSIINKNKDILIYPKLSKDTFIHYKQ